MTNEKTLVFSHAHFFVYKFYIGYSFGNFTPEIKFFIRFSQERIFS